MARDGKLPGMSGDPLDALAKAARSGAIDLSQVQAPPPRTLHTTDFRSTLVGFEEVTGEDGAVTEYRMVLFDQMNNHKYQFAFDGNIKKLLQDALEELLPIGEQREAPSE